LPFWRSNCIHQQFDDAMSLYIQAAAKSSVSLLHTGDAVCAAVRTLELMPFDSGAAAHAHSSHADANTSPGPLICTASASVNSPAPTKNSNITLTTVLNCTEESGRGNRSLSLALQDDDDQRQRYRLNGVAAARSIGNATSGYAVVIDVTVSKAGQTWTAQTSFTPQ
jgi:hypothetical protein